MEVLWDILFHNDESIYFLREIVWVNQIEGKENKNGCKFSLQRSCTSFKDCMSV